MYEIGAWSVLSKFGMSLRRCAGLYESARLAPVKVARELVASART